MKKIIIFAMLSLFMLVAHTVCAADSPTAILDKAATKIKNGGGVNMNFTLSADGGSPVDGNMRMSGKKFCCSIEGVVTWFNGKTMWTYVKQNEEVNVTTPSATDVAKMNPYSLLSIYKTGYKAAMGKSTSIYYEIVLTREKQSGAFKKIVVRINKHNMQPVYVHTETDKATTTIRVTSYKNERLGDSVFTFNPKKYPDVDVIDLR